MVVSHTTSSSNRPPSVVRNLSPYFVSQESDFAPSPASSSSSFTSDSEPSYSSGYSMGGGVHDLLLYTNTPRLNLPSYEDRISCSSEEEQAQDWDWKNISDVMGLGITFWASNIVARISTRSVSAKLSSQLNSHDYCSCICFNVLLHLQKIFALSGLPRLVIVGATLRQDICSLCLYATSPFNILTPREETFGFVVGIFTLFATRWASHNQLIRILSLNTKNLDVFFKFIFLQHFYGINQISNVNMNNSRSLKM